MKLFFFIKILKLSRPGVARTLVFKIDKYLAPGKRCLVYTLQTSFINLSCTVSGK